MCHVQRIVLLAELNGMREREVKLHGHVKFDIDRNSEGHFITVKYRGLLSIFPAE